MKNKKNNLNEVKRVIFNDYSDYQSNTCHTGGNYGFWTNYNRLPNGKWQVSYGTTADFSYCPCCGTFEDHYEGDEAIYDSGYSCGDFEQITESELLGRINNFKETDNEYIEYE